MIPTRQMYKLLAFMYGPEILNGDRPLKNTQLFLEWLLCILKQQHSSHVAFMIVITNNEPLMSQVKIGMETDHKYTYKLHMKYILVS
jgi:hypothetical protein